MQYIQKIHSFVAETIDDGREQDATTWNGAGNSSNVITFGNVSGSKYSGAFRFRSIDIPRNAKIVFARIRMRPSVTDAVDPDVKLVIKGIKEGDTKPFTQASRPSQRSKTVNSIPWHIIKKWEVHEWTQTPNLKLIIEEIVAQAEWKAGNALAITVEDNGSASNQAETCYDMGKGEGYGAELDIWYTTSNVSIGTIAGTDRDGTETDRISWQSNPTGNARE